MAMLYNIFDFSMMLLQNKLECLLYTSVLKSSLIFVNEAGAYPRGAPYG